MKNLLSDPQGLLVLCCIGGLIVGLNLTLIGLLRGDPRVRLETSRWTSAFTGSRTARRQEEANYAELHQRVAKLNQPPGGEQPPRPPADG